MASVRVGARDVNVMGVKGYVRLFYRNLHHAYLDTETID